MAAAFGKRGMKVQSFAPAQAPAFAPATAAAPAYAASTPQPASVSRAAPSRVPVVTIFLLILFCVIYAVEVRHSVHGFLSARTLFAFGALSGDAVFQHGQVWRLFTAVLLHASLSHVIGNAVVFAIVGVMLEPLIGPRWFAGLFAIGGLGGALASLSYNPGDMPAVGASGAIMGVLGAAFFCGASAKAGPKGRKMQTWALRLILPALIPFGGGDAHVDYACHIGGLLAGLATGVLLQASWARGEDRPAFNNAGAVIGGVSLVIALLAFAFGTQPASAIPQPQGLIPEEQVPENLDIGTEKARELVARYPQDPRAHLLRGFAFLEDGQDLADAEEQFRQALAAKDFPAAQMTPDFEKTVSALLSLTVAYQHRPDSARAIGGPTCGFAAEHLGNIHEEMVKEGICDA